MSTTAPPAGIRFYTVEEAERIIYAWARLMDFAEDSRDQRAVTELSTLLDNQVARLEGFAEPVTQARALLLSTLADAAEMQPANLWFYYDAPRQVMALYSWAYRDELVSAGTMRLARKAHDTHRDATRRYLSSLIGA